jgi:putative hydrolase of HD superfamily
LVVLKQCHFFDKRLKILCVEIANRKKGPSMDRIADLLFEARMLKEIPRSGYHFLGAGKETVAEHSFLTTFIAYVMGRMRPEADRERLTAMCLLHDLPESRTGDLNYVQKRYVEKDEERAVADAVRDLPFGEEMAQLVAEFNEGRTLEARLAHDADQLSFVLDLKALSDVGYRPPEKWLAHIVHRLKTDTGRRMCDVILSTESDRWWLKNYVDRPDEKH